MQSLSFVFTDPTEFRAAMRAEGVRQLLITGLGNFRARLIRVALKRLVLADIHENLDRVAFLQVPDDRILFMFVNRPAHQFYCAGTAVRPNDLVILGPGQCAHVHSAGASHWGTIWLPLVEFAQYAGALVGSRVRVPERLIVRPVGKPESDEVYRLHAAATNWNLSSSGILAEPEAGRGLEQQLIYSLISCVSDADAITVNPSLATLIELATRFEKFLATEPNRDLRVTEISSALGVSSRQLQKCCNSQLAIGASKYLRLRRSEKSI